MAEVRMTIDEFDALRRLISSERESEGAIEQSVVSKRKKTRKVSKYQKTFGKHFKSLKLKHPRTQVSTLMKRAHRMTKTDLK